MAKIEKSDIGIEALNLLINSQPKLTAIQEIAKNIDFTKIPTSNNGLSGIIKEHLAKHNLTVTQLLESLNHVNNGFRKVYNNIDFDELEKTINKQNEWQKNIGFFIESEEYKELTRKAIIEDEKEFNLWKEVQKIEFENTFNSLKNYLEVTKKFPPKNFDEFFEFWSKLLPDRPYEYEISNRDFLKFHLYKKDKLDKEDLLLILEHELSQKPTITEKLNCWLEIKDNFKDIYYKAGTESLAMPESIYKAHFEPHRTEPEYVYWLLKYEAKDFFERILLTQSEIALAETKEELEYQLNKIVERENLVEQNRKLKNYDYTKVLYKLDGTQNYDIEYLRIKNNYHSNFDKTKHSTYDGFVNDTNVSIYANHILLKNYLEAKLKELEQPSPAIPLTKSNISAPKKQPKKPTAEKDKSLGDANHKVNVFESIFKVRKNIKDSLHEFESKEFRGFSKRTLDRAIKIKYNDSNLTFNSYVERYLTDNLTDKNKKINS